MNVVKKMVNNVVVFHTVDGVDQLGGLGPELERKVRREMSKGWPIAMIPIKLMAKPGDRGAGDIIARIIGPLGGEAFKAWYKKIFGRECGCNARQDAWNAIYPL